MMMFKVGGKCPVEVQEGASILFMDSSFTVFIKMSDLYEEDILSFRDNELKLALCKYDPKTLFFVYGIKRLVYMSDIAFHIGLTTDKLSGLKENIEEGTGYGFTFVLIEEETNTIKAIRTVAITKNFSEIINECFKEQYQAGTEGYEDTVKEVFKQYNAEQLVQKYIVGGCRFRGRENVEG